MMDESALELEQDAPRLRLVCDASRFHACLSCARCLAARIVVSARARSDPCVQEFQQFQPRWL